MSASSEVDDLEVFYESSLGDQSGPISVTELLTLIKGKKVTQDTLIWYDELSDWTAMKDTALGKSLLTKAANAKPPPPPPPPKSASTSTTISSASASALSSPENLTKPLRSVSAAVATTTTSATTTANTAATANTSANAKAITDAEDNLLQAEMDIQLSQSLIEDNIDVIEKCLQKSNLSKLLQSAQFSSLIPLNQKLKDESQSLDSKLQTLVANLEAAKTKISSLEKDSKTKLTSALDTINKSLLSLRSHSQVARTDASGLNETIESIKSGETLRKLLTLFKSCKDRIIIQSDKPLKNLHSLLDSAKSCKSDDKKFAGVMEKVKEDVKKLTCLVDKDVEEVNQELVSKNVHIDNGALHIECSDLQISIMLATESIIGFVKQTDSLNKSYASLMIDISRAEKAVAVEVANAMKTELGGLKSQLNALKTAVNNSSDSSSSSSSGGVGSKPPPPPPPQALKTGTTTINSKTNDSSGAASNPTPSSAHSVSSTSNKVLPPPKPERSAIHSPSSATAANVSGGGLDNRASIPRYAPPPVPPPVPQSALEIDDHDNDFEVKANNRTSKRLSDKDKRALGSKIAEASALAPSRTEPGKPLKPSPPPAHIQHSNSNSSNSNSSSISNSSGGGAGGAAFGGVGSAIVNNKDKIELLRADAAFLTNSKASKALTIGKLDLLGGVKRQGELKKAAKFTGIYKNRYFVLDVNRFEYYEKASDALVSNKCKVLILGPNTVIKYGQEENSLIVDGIDEEGKSQSWSLLCDNVFELEEWNNALGAHIHVHFKRENAIFSDFFDEGDICTTFWRVPPSAPNPVGIRSLPFIEGPKTNNGVYPGEIVEVTQTITRDGDRNTFMRIGDDRGWVFEKHPKAFYNLFTKLRGVYKEEEQSYQYNCDDQTVNLNLFAGPSLDSEILTDSSFTPGSKIHTIASFTLDSLDDSPFPMTFLKLYAPRGWVLMQNIESGADVLVKLK